MDSPLFHRDILRRLAEEARTGRVAQGLMVCGPQGTGKLTLAVEYARVLGCERPLQSEDVVWVFPVAKDARRGRETCDDYLPLWRDLLRENPYADLEEWTRRMDAPTGAQPLIYARESDVLARKLALKAAAQTGRRVVIVWLPECLHEAAANKLLKLLEEPPQGTVFILVTEEPERVLPTVKSRMQRLELPPIGVEELTTELQKRTGVAPETAMEAARRATGSWPKALANLEGDATREAMLEDFTALMRLAWTRRAREMKEWSETMATRGRTRQTAFLAYTGRMLRESFISNLGRGEMVYLTGREREFTNRFAPYVNERNIEHLATLTEEAQEHIVRNVNPRMVFFDYILKVTVALRKGKA